MPRSSRYGRTGGLPRTLRRSCHEAQETYTKAHENAVRTYGAGDQADRAAYDALKQDFEKRGDHWVAKEGGCAGELRRHGLACASASVAGSAFAAVSLRKDAARPKVQPMVWPAR
jgi:hypothetical protein